MCTRILSNDNAVATVASRCMDWAVSDEPDLWYLPAGLHRDGHGDETSLTWTSNYASVVVSMWRLGTVDGINERGLAAHALYLDDVVYEPHDERPSVANAMAVQYFLDSFGTVAEVVENVHRVRITSPDIRGQQLGVHYAIEDTTGDSAVLEPINGKIVVHHGPQFRVMANSPVLEQQLQNLTRYKPFGGELPPPGDITSADRFVRASYFLHYLPEPESVEQAVAGVYQLIQNVAVPYGAPYDDGGVYPTWWESVVDTTHRTYYFASTRSPSVIWVELDELLARTEVLSLDPREESLVGNVAAELRPATLPY